MAVSPRVNPAAIVHPGEERGNELRQHANSMEPRCLRTFTPSLAVIDKSAGSYHWTVDGRKLADFSSGVLVANLGHNPAGWWRRVLAYLGVDSISAENDFAQAVPLTAYNAVTTLEIDAADRVIQSLQGQPGGRRMEQVLWAASGSEAITKALWAALKRDPQRDVILATRGGFHGKKGLAGAVTGSEHDPERDPRVRFLSFPTHECRSIQARREPIDLGPYQRELAAVRDEQQDRLCCLITEPYLGGGGSFHPQREYLQLLERFCRENDLIFILDEVQSNFGRTGPMYAFTHYGVEPDIVVLGKGLGNGVPVSAAVGTAELFGAMQYGEGSDTWSGNALSCAAVLATLDEFESADVLGHAAGLAAVIEEGLCRLTQLPLVRAVRGEGVVWGVECAGVGHHSAAEVANACVLTCYRGDEEGMAVHLLGPLADKVLRVSPPLVMPLADARTYLDVMHRLCEKLADELARS